MNNEQLTRANEIQSDLKILQDIKKSFEKASDDFAKNSEQRIQQPKETFYPLFQIRFDYHSSLVLSDMFLPVKSKDLLSIYLHNVNTKITELEKEFESL